MFERIDVLGVTDYTFTLTAHAKARGGDAVIGAGFVSEKEGQSGRGERICAATSDAIVRSCNSPIDETRSGPRRCRYHVQDGARERSEGRCPKSQLTSG